MKIIHISQVPTTGRKENTLIQFKNKKGQWGRQRDEQMDGQTKRYKDKQHEKLRRNEIDRKMKGQK